MFLRDGSTAGAATQAPAVILTWFQFSNPKSEISNFCRPNMAEQEETRTITMVTGELIGDTWREKDDIVVCEKAIAERWVKYGSAVYGGAAGDTKTTAAFEPADFPGADKFLAAGISTIDGVKALIDANGDAWPKQVKGITKPIAAAVSAKLEELAAPPIT